MRARSSGKKAVAVTVLYNVVFGTARSRQSPGHGFPPDVDVVHGVFVYHGLAGCAGTHVHFHDPVLGAGAESVRVVFPKVVLGGTGQFFNVRQTVDVPGFDSPRVHPLPVKGHMGIEGFHQVFEVGKLEFLPRLCVHTFIFGIENHSAILCKAAYKMEQ